MFRREFMKLALAAGVCFSGGSTFAADIPAPFDKPEDVKIIGGDSTAGNTGQNNGAFVLIDEITGTPHNHFICCLHLTELPLRHLTQFYLGKTKGPNSFDSELGNAIRDLKNPKIANRIS